MTSTVWNPNGSTVPQINAAGLIKQELVVAVAGQTTINLQTFNYAPNSNSVVVTKNGKMLARNKDYDETSAGVVTLRQAASDLDEILVIGFVGITGSAVVDAVLRSDLGAGTGATIVKATLGKVNSIVRSLASKVFEVVSITDYIPVGTVLDGNTDVTAYVQKAIDSFPDNIELWIPPSVSLGVTRIVIQNKTNFSIRVDGKIINLGTKPGAAGVDTNNTERGKQATFYILNCAKFKIYGEGYINPRYREAFCIGEDLVTNTASPCTDFVISVDMRGTGLNDNMHANRIRYCTNFSFSDLNADGLTYKVPYVDNTPGSYYRSFAEALLFWDCSDFAISNIQSTNQGMNGIYIGSNCERFSIKDSKFTHNAGSGIQLAWSSFGIFPRYFSISDNQCWFNRADGWDLNNTTDVQDVFGIINANISAYNGWGTEDTTCTKPTNDGSGIGTYRQIKKLTISDNIDVECSRAGCYMELVWDSSVYGNIIKKEAGLSNGDGLFFLRCTNVSASGNNVNVLPSKWAMRMYGDNPTQGNVRVENNYFYGQISYAGGAYAGHFNSNNVLTTASIDMPVNCNGNVINVTGAGQNGLNITVDDVVISNNTVTATSFAILSFGRWSPKILNNKATGGVGGIRVDTCAYGKVSGNKASGQGSPGIHFLACDNMELSSNQASSVTGNSYRVEAECTLTHKWANRSISGPLAYAGTYGINY